jgi:EAL domain-containing protein (putative c-di-GMP-specific phosphodiesterase class I)
MEYCIDLSKRDGKGKTIRSDSAIVAKIKRKNHIIERMKIGLAQDAFRVFFQPIYSRRENRFTTAEALLRFTDGELGTVSPGEFIPIAEEADLIGPISLMVLDKVCKFLTRLDQHEIAIETVSINVSTLHLNSADFVRDCLSTIDANGISPSKLRMEVTETVFIANNDHVEKVLKQMEARGVQFSIDDFGTGYANIANIIRLPFESIKFDRGFLYDSMSDARTLSVLKGLCTTFSDVGMKVVIEGVETVAQMQLAETINVDYVQGFLFALPMPEDEAIRYLGKTFVDPAERIDPAAR